MDTNLCGVPGVSGVPCLSGLESSLPQSEPPCLIVEDSQPDSIALEDDPETSYRALLSKRLSILQPRENSPVLELLQSPVGSRGSQSNSQSQPHQPEAEMEPSFEESKVLEVSNRNCPSEEMDSRESQSLHHEEGTSQFGFLELSQSQDFGSEPVQQNATKPKTDEPSSLRPMTSLRPQSRVCPSQVPVELLWHSQNQDRDHQEQEEMLSQEDLFDKTDAAPDLVCPSIGPSQSLALLQLSGGVQGTLVHNSLSQSSVDYVAPTPENLTPMIVPSSPTDQHSEEPMNTSLPPSDQSAHKASGPAPLHVCQKTPGFERPLSMPSQPDFSHDVFVPTQSQDHSSPHTNPLLDSTPFASVNFSESSAAVSVHLSINSELQDEDDEEATQIEQMDDTFKISPQKSLKMDSLQNVAKSLNVGSQISVKAQSQEANDHPETSEQGLNANSQGSAHAKFQLTRSVQEVVSVSQAKMVNVNNEKESFSAQNLSTQSVPDMFLNKEAVKVDSLTKTVNVNHEEEVQNMSQESANAGKETTRSVDNMVLEKDIIVVASQTKMMNVPHGNVGSSSNQGSANANKQPTGFVQEIASGSQTKTMNELHNEKKEASLSQGCANARQQPDTGAYMISDGLQTKLLNENYERVVGNVRGEEADKDTSLGLVLSQSEVIMSGTRGQDGGGGDKMAAVRNGDGTKSLNSSGEISFHFTLPKESDLIVPVSATPPLISHQKPSSLRHSTPIEVNTIFQNSSDLMMAEGSDVSAEGADGKLSLRKKLVTPVEESSSESFSLQKPTLSDEDMTVSRTLVQTLQSSPSVFSRVQQVHRQEPEENSPVRGARFSSPQRNSIVFNSLPNSQSDASEVQEVTSQPHSLSNKNKEKNQNAPGAEHSHKKGEPETPPPRRPGPAHHRHTRIIQEVRTTVTRIITDVYYEDGQEVNRTVTQESDEPVVQFHALDESPSRTGTSSVTSGDLADISSSTCTTGTTSSSTTGTTSAERPTFLPPLNRGTKHRRGAGARARSSVSVSPRGTSRRGRPPSRSSPHQSRLPPAVSLHNSQQVSAPDYNQSSSGSSFVGLRVVAKWSSNGYFYSGRIIEDLGTGPGSRPGSEPGLGESRFRLRFDDGYECELCARDILLCNPIPIESEITALNQDQTYSTGVIKGHKMEGSELLYLVETRAETRNWFNRTAVILSLDQGNRLREQHGLGPYHPGTALPKAADISLDNLVEGKRKRRGAQSTLNTLLQAISSPRVSHLRPSHSPGSKRKLGSERTTQAKRGRHGAVQQVLALNTSDSGSDLGICSGLDQDLVSTHGPLPQNQTLFQGFVFLLTASSERDRLTNKDQDQEDLVQTGPYSKNYTETQLQTGGGIVLKEFNQQQCEAAYQSLLIADVYCRSRTYLLCLASGVPCVSHLWVRDCCRDNTLHNHRNYLLPAGVGPESTVREWRSRSSPFKSLRVLLVLKDQVQFWSELIRLGGGTALIHSKDHTEFPAGSLDVAVSDPACGMGLVQLELEPELNQVSVEWILQSIICGERLDYSSFPLMDLDDSSSS